MVDCFGHCTVCLRCFGDCLTPHIFRRDRRPVRLASCGAAIAHLTYGIHFQRGTFGWHAFVAGLYGVAAINFLVNPLLGVVLLALIVGVVLIAEGIVEIGLFFVLREYHHSIWILIDGIVTLGFGFVVCEHWPPAAPELVQYLVGISFISSGISRLSLGFALRVVEPTEAPVE